MVAPGLVVMGETHKLKVMGLNLSNIYWMYILSHICCKNCNVCSKINEKEAGVGPEAGVHFKICKILPIVTTSPVANLIKPLRS